MRQAFGSSVKMPASPMSSTSASSSRLQHTHLKDHGRQQWRLRWWRFWHSPCLDGFLSYQLWSGAKAYAGTFFTSQNNNKHIHFFTFHAQISAALSSLCCIIYWHLLLSSKHEDKNLWGVNMVGYAAIGVLTSHDEGMVPNLASD